MRNIRPLSSLSRVLGPMMVGGEWTSAVAGIILVQILAFGLQLAVAGDAFFAACSLGGLDPEAYDPWRFLSFLFVNHPDAAIGACQLALNLFVFGMIAGDPGQTLGNRRFLLAYAVTAVGSAVGGILPMASQEVFGAIGPVAGTVFMFGMLNPARRIYGRIPARVFAFVLLILLVGGHFALLSFEEPVVGQDGTTYGPHDPWAFASQATGGVVAAYLYFLVRPAFLRRRQVREMFRTLRELQEEAALRERVDALLEKISREGFASLSREERRFLERASRHIQEVKERERDERRRRKKSENSFF